MGINCQRFSLDKVSGAEPGAFACEELLPGEIDEVRTELVSIEGPFVASEEPGDEVCVVLIGLAGRGTVQSAGSSFEVVGESIARPPYAAGYTVEVPDGGELHLLRVAKSLDETDRAVIAGRPGELSGLYAARFADCPTYSEGIKSAKTVNRMLLTEGQVPRFCLGSVETTGPDSVGAHEHPMLDQLFLGLRDCRCTVRADDAEALLTGDCLLHIPLGSSHSVSVAEGDTLYYVWFDFFHTLDGEAWIRDQHIMDE